MPQCNAVHTLSVCLSVCLSALEQVFKIVSWLVVLHSRLTEHWAQKVLSSSVWHRTFWFINAIVLACHGSSAGFFWMTTRLLHRYNCFVNKSEYTGVLIGFSCFIDSHDPVYLSHWSDRPWDRGPEFDSWRCFCSLSRPHCLRIHLRRTHLALWSVSTELKQ